MDSTLINNLPPKVVAVVVSYHPEIPAFKQLLDATLQQVDSMVVVDNTPDAIDGLMASCPENYNLHYICLRENMGIAYAHNIGIEWAYEQGAEYILILDQDSIPYLDMVQKLKQNLDVFSDGANMSNIAAVGPIYMDTRTQLLSHFKVSRFSVPYRYSPETTNPSQKAVIVTFLISSGALIPMQALLDFGGMRSNYFIDHVDTEWCFRARSRGYKLLGAPNAIMQHSLGDKVKRIWLFHMRNVAYHSPLRDYYMFRNTLLMIRDVEIPFIQRILLLVRLVQFKLYFLVFAQERRLRAYSMALGIWHGLRNISGRLDLTTGKCTLIPKTRFDPS